MEAPVLVVEDDRNLGLYKLREIWQRVECLCCFQGKKLAQNRLLTMVGFNE